jgi:penicillin-binding protein 1A
VLVQLASGEQLRLTGEGLKWLQPALAPKARRQVAVQRGSVIRVMRQDRLGPNGEVQWQSAQWPDTQGALVALDPRSGRVRAWVGGFDFGEQNFDHVLSAWRQPGSSFKPFIYSAALEHGVMPATLINDAELILPGAYGPDSWSPKNSDGQFDGPLRLRDALARSKNTVSIRLLQHVGLPDARDWIERFGFDPDRQPNNLTLALGSGATTPLQLAQGYAVFANGGHRVTPTLIERITDAHGQVLFEAPAPEPLAEDSRVVDARNAFVVGSLLNEVTRTGTAAKAQQQLGRGDLYGKTGTTNDAVDAWFAGYQPGRVAVVWLGYDEPRSLGDRESGGGLALPVWIAYMRQALSSVPPQAPPVAPEGVQRAGGDWVYDEWVEGGFVRAIGLEMAAQPAIAPASAPALAPSGEPR